MIHRALRSAVAHLLPAAAFLAALLAEGRAEAFCGFYVGGADSKLFNNATQVIMMRENTRTVLSMQNNYEGPPENFAMIVPVPVILQKENVKTLPKDLFEKVDRLTAPRLVEYWEQDPCAGSAMADKMERSAGKAAMGPAAARAAPAKDLGVTIEAQFDVGEYDIVILSAKDSSGLDTWLKQEKYTIPSGAEPYLRPYVQAGSKFFVAKVDPKRVTFEKGQAALSPLRFHYDSNDFSLPVRLGLINSRGTQDLIVNILASDRFQAANYPNVTIPTNLDLAEGSKPHFGRFYAALFDRTVEKNPKAVVTEYSWDASSCDPCPGPALSPEDYATLGADALPSAGAPTQPQVVLDAVKGTGAPAARDLVARRFKPRVDSCWFSAVGRKPKSGHVDVKLAWDADGKVKDVSVGRNETEDKQIADCVQKAFEGGMMPPEATTMTASYLMNLKPQINYKQWTITRLHARYSKQALGEDIVFKVAKPIMGGRESMDAKGKLEHGATETTMNNFQGRYAIRHAWVGPIECKQPQRGVWGGPWEYNRGESNQPQAAEKTAFVPRGGIALPGFVRTDVPELGVAAGKGALPEIAALAPSASPADLPPGAPAGGPAASGGCSRCSATTAPASGTLGGGGALGLALTLALRRRRRRAERGAA